MRPSDDLTVGRCIYAECCEYILMSASALCMWSCQRVLLVLLFINPLLLLVCLCVLWLYITARRFIFRPSIWLNFRPSVCMSVCVYVHMYLCRDERTSVCTVDIENWIDLTDILSGLSLHWTLISFFFVLFYRVAVQMTTLPVCAPFYAKTVLTIAKKVHIYLWAIASYYSTSRLWQWRSG